MAVAALGSIAPYPAEGLDYLAGMGEDNVADFKAALKGGEEHRQTVEASATKLLKADLQSLTQALQSLLCPGDAAALTTDFANFVLRSVRQGIGETRDGMLDDDVAHLAPWGFELGQIRIPVLLMHGERDQFVPVSHSKWLASKIPNAETRFLPEEGHLPATWASKVDLAFCWMDCLVRFRQLPCFWIRSRNHDFCFAFATDCHKEWLLSFHVRLDDNDDLCHKQCKHEAARHHGSCCSGV